MTENTGASAEQGDQTAGQTGDVITPPAPTPPQTSPPDGDAKLLSRIAGLDAKVTSLAASAKAAEEARIAAEKKLSEYEAGKVSTDEALRAQLEARDRELALVRKEATVAKIAAAYPETFGVFGDAVAAMTPDQLAAAEARFAGTPGTGYRSPGANPPRDSGKAKDPSEMTLAELRDAMRNAPETVWNESWSSKPAGDW